MSGLGSAKSRTPFFKQRPLAALDSSDEARTDTDTATSPSMHLASSPVTDATSRNNSGAAAGTIKATARTSSSHKRRNADAVGSCKPPPNQRKYERKTKRFIWPDDLHRLFVAAIFDVGLKNASPKALLTLMEAAGPNTGLTTEHLKSHLQKYRLNYERSRMEFLEFYDRSAKRNLKRRRCQAQQRSNDACTENNTMFVFPITNSKRQKSRKSNSDSDASRSDTDGRSQIGKRLSTIANCQVTPQKQRESPAAEASIHAQNMNYAQLMQNAQQQVLLDESTCVQQQSPIINARLMPIVTAPISMGKMPIGLHHLPPAYAAHAQRKQVYGHDCDLAAGAVGTCRHSLGHASNSTEPLGMAELSDPQWNILNSLMSPQLAGITEPVEEGMFATSEAMAHASSNASGYNMFQGQLIDLRLKMHLAMQAQMNLHRQMLTRKVEVAQHLACHDSMGASVDAGTVPKNGSTSNPQRGFSNSWSNLQQLQQYQQLDQHQQQQQYLQPMVLHSRPTLSTPEFATSVPGTASREPSNILVTAPLNGEAMAVSTVITDGRSQGLDSGLAADSKSDDDGIDLYRWDRIDLNVGLDDDDLFGFLKS
ncbi:uncharacterized protein CCR75_009396 [Bremia lactucae]|uniref:Myb-like domain-containing protein n=1 Tax=Bremia lactucae TaxID=4779 RepID=A0A976NZQ9_BRELC|nr:hypothetical protein CCR75_009396 [Bremia lactucae]